MGKRTAIIVGHNSRAPGAVRVTDGTPEYIWNTKLAKSIQALAEQDGRGDDVRIFWREPGMGYAREIDEVYARVNAWDPDIALEFHFNAASPAATGTEMLYAKGSRAGEPLAQRLQVATVEALGLRDRGLKALTRTSRGGRSVWAAKAPAVLTEWFFGSNPGDCAAADKNFDALACSVWRIIK